jgi:hypothetical protein
MNKTSKIVYRQFIRLVFRKHFSLQQIIDRLHLEYLETGFKSLDHLIIMVFAQIAQLSSLRSVASSINAVEGRFKAMGLSAEPHRATLGYANSHRDWNFFREAFFLFLMEVRTDLGRRGIILTPSFIEQTVILFDSTTIELSAKLFDWALFRRAKGGIKVHTACDFNYLPLVAIVTPAKTHDVTVLEEVVDAINAQRKLDDEQATITEAALDAINAKRNAEDGQATIVGEDVDDMAGLVFDDVFPTGSILVFDRGYIKFTLFRKLQDLKLFFVTRAKINMKYVVDEELTVPDDVTPADPDAAVVVKDEIISLIGVKSGDCPYQLRMVTAKDKVTGKIFRFLTNLREPQAHVISALYRSRWKVEILFKFMKQHNILHSFLGTTENAVKTQVWASVISMLFVRYFHLIASNKIHWCFSTTVDLLKTNLFCYISIEEMLENPYHIRAPSLILPECKPVPASSMF